MRADLDKQGRRLVFTNGCFDLLHAGHVRYLAEARALGDALVVALNSDESVRQLKGPSRPVNTEEDRAEILTALRSVDAVCVFHEPRVTSLIETIQPHVYAKGGDYTLESLNPEERGALEKVGARIEILGLVPGRSTTATLKRVAEGKTPPEKAKLRIGVLGSGGGSNFQAILAAINEGRLAAEVVCVISDNADGGMMKTARAAGLPAFVVDPGPNPRRFPEAAQKEVCELLQRAAVDVVVLAGFMRVLKEPTLSGFAGRIINIHPSLLPKFRGSNAVQQAIEAGELETGTTIHLVTAEVDAGRILAQASVPIHIGDRAETVHERIKQEEHKLLPQVLADWSNLSSQANLTSICD
ncbi:MAG: Phosphoribosylglycinamide formyltransferase [Verrucomicrobiaceae bacterium]|nr:Phosphoribosylglycinamide formyltransferase [Verrucomicrobiaceae bacterium]